MKLPSTTYKPFQNFRSSHYTIYRHEAVTIVTHTNSMRLMSSDISGFSDILQKVVALQFIKPAWCNFASNITGNNKEIDVIGL